MRAPTGALLVSVLLIGIELFHFTIHPLQWTRLIALVVGVLALIAVD
jgi:hypothetical protein